VVIRNRQPPEEKRSAAELIMGRTGNQNLAMLRVYTQQMDAFRDDSGNGPL
jgi:hypothetical protein